MQTYIHGVKEALIKRHLDELWPQPDDYRDDDW